MDLSDTGRDVLKIFEGCELEAYHDVAGLLTIGYGHLLTQSEITSGKIWVNATPIRYSDGITAEDADCILQHDTQYAGAIIETSIQVPLAQHQFDALCCFVVNIGAEAFRHSTLRKLLNQGQYDAVPAQLRRWIFAGGKRVNGLVKRREQEIALWNRDSEAEVLPF